MTIGMPKGDPSNAQILGTRHQHPLPSKRDRNQYIQRWTITGMPESERERNQYPALHNVPESIPIRTGHHKLNGTHLLTIMFDASENLKYTSIYITVARKA